MYLLSILLKNLFGKGHCIGVLLLFKHLIVYEIGSGRNGHLLRSKLSYKQNKNKRNSKFANLFPRGPHIQVLVCVFVYYFFFFGLYIVFSNPQDRGGRHIFFGRNYPSFFPSTKIWQKRNYSKLKIKVLRTQNTYFMMKSVKFFKFCENSCWKQTV